GRGRRRQRARAADGGARRQYVSERPSVDGHGGSFAIGAANSQWLLLRYDQLFLHLGVHAVRQDLLRNQLVRLGVGAALDDLVGVGGADVGHGLELRLGRRI